MKIYILTDTVSYSAGHGQTGESVTIATKDVYSFKPYPVFNSKKKAKTFVAGLDWWYRNDIQIMEFEVV
jgi:hypothetical protein